jgi:hypothetical protein
MKSSVFFHLREAASQNSQLYKTWGTAAITRETRKARILPFALYIATKTALFLYSMLSQVLSLSHSIFKSNSY